MDEKDLEQKIKEVSDYVAKANEQNSKLDRSEKFKQAEKFFFGYEGGFDDHLKEVKKPKEIVSSDTIESDNLKKDLFLKSKLTDDPKVRRFYKKKYQGRLNDLRGANAPSPGFIHKPWDGKIKAPKGYSWVEGKLVKDKEK